MAGDLGIEGGPAVTSALLSLIDFYVDNKVIETDDEGNETFPVNAAQIGIDTQVRRFFLCGELVITMDVNHVIYAENK